MLIKEALAKAQDASLDDLEMVRMSDMPLILCHVPHWQLCDFHTLRVYFYD